MKQFLDSAPVDLSNLIEVGCLGWWKVVKMVLKYGFGSA